MTALLAALWGSAAWGAGGPWIPEEVREVIVCDRSDELLQLPTRADHVLIATQLERGTPVTLLFDALGWVVGSDVTLKGETARIQRGAALTEEATPENTHQAELLAGVDRGQPGCWVWHRRGPEASLWHAQVDPESLRGWASSMASPMVTPVEIPDRVGLLPWPSWGHPPIDPLPRLRDPVALVPEGPEALELLRESLRHELLGLRAMANGDRAGAEAAFTEELRLRRALVVEAPGPEAEVLLVAALDHFAEQAIPEGWTPAVKLLREAIEDSAPWIGSPPGASSLNERAWELAIRARRTRSLAPFRVGNEHPPDFVEEALAFAQRLQANHPTDRQAIALVALLDEVGTPRLVLAPKAEVRKYFLSGQKLLRYLPSTWWTRQLDRRVTSGLAMSWPLPLPKVARHAGSGSGPTAAAFERWLATPPLAQARFDRSTRRTAEDQPDGWGWREDGLTWAEIRCDDADSLAHLTLAEGIPTLAAQWEPGTPLRLGLNFYGEVLWTDGHVKAEAIEDLVERHGLKDHPGGHLVTSKGSLALIRRPDGSWLSGPARGDPNGIQTFLAPLRGCLVIYSRGQIIAAAADGRVVDTWYPRYRWPLRRETRTWGQAGQERFVRIQQQGKWARETWTARRRMALQINFDHRSTILPTRPELWMASPPNLPIGSWVNDLSVGRSHGRAGDFDSWVRRAQETIDDPSEDRGGIHLHVISSLRKDGYAGEILDAAEQLTLEWNATRSPELGELSEDVRKPLQQAIIIARRRLERHPPGSPRHPEVLGDLRRLHSELAITSSDQGDVPGMLAAASEAVALGEALVALDPSAEVRLAVLDDLEQLANAAEHSDDLERARATWARAEALCRSWSEVPRIRWRMMGIEGQIERLAP